MPDQLTVQAGAVAGPDGMPVILLVPTWCGSPGEGDAHLAPLLELGTLLDNTLDAVRYGTSLSVFDPHIVNGQRTFMETCSLPALDGAGVDVLVEAMAKAVSAGCAIFTHEFRGAASRVPVEATAFGLRRDHMLIEILASFPDRSDRLEERRHQQWVWDTWHAFDAIALPGGYPNLLGPGEPDRVSADEGRLSRHRDRGGSPQRRAVAHPQRGRGAFHRAGWHARHRGGEKEMGRARRHKRYRHEGRASCLV